MPLLLLIYSHATGRLGPRTIEAASHRNVAVRSLRANPHSDHDSIRAALCGSMPTAKFSIKRSYGW